MHRVALFISLFLMATASRAESISKDVDLRTFAYDKPLAERVTNLPLAEIKTGQLTTDQGNIATDNQFVSFELKATARFPVNISGRTVQPGQTVLFEHPVNNRGEVSIPVYPATKGTVGSSDFELRVNNVSSVHDRFWEPASPTYTAWKDTGTRNGWSSWLPAVNRQMTSFVQSRNFNKVFSRTEQQRRHDTNTDIYENVGDPISHTKNVPDTESRQITAGASDWANSGTPYGCSTWTPGTDHTFETLMFVQSRNCSQNQSRTWNYKAGTTSIGSHTQSKVITVSQNRNVEGTKPLWVSGSSTFSPWVNEGDRNTYSSWAPSAGNQTSGYSQTRTYKQKQARNEQKREWSDYTNEFRPVGSPIKHTQVIGGTENRSVAVTVSGWSYVSTNSCTTWSPATLTVESGKAFTQSRSCNKNRKRTWSHKVGTSLIHSSVESGTYTQNETRNATGGKVVWFASSSTFTGWANEGSRYSHSGWTPAAGNQTSGYSQTRSYKQNQFRNEQKREKNAETGEYRNVGSAIKRTQTVTSSESRNVAVTVSGWSYVSTNSCTAWLPATSTVESGIAFMQSRSCNKNRNRTWSHKVGASLIHSRIEAGTYTQHETLNATGGKEVWFASTSTFTGWVDEGGRYGHSNWTPAAGNQTSGYTQTRSYKQNQTRNEQKREKHAETGAYRNIGGAIKRSQTVTRSESRTIAVTVGGWSDVSTNSCTTWSPATSTVESGKAFTQSRSCNKNRNRSWSHKVGTTLVHSRVETGTYTQDETRNATGGKEVWFASTSTFTGWVNEGGRYSYSGWTPAAGNQTSGYSQTRSYKQNQTRNEQKREKHAETGAYRNVGSAIKRTQAVTSSESRNVAVTVGGWSYVSTNSCAEWTPLPSTVYSGTSFNQSRSCNKNGNRTWSHKVGTSLVHSHVENGTYSDTENRTSVGTKEVWLDTLSTFTTSEKKQYNTWLPVPDKQTSDYTQTRSYNLQLTRTEQKRERNLVTGQYRNVGAPIATIENSTGTESRRVKMLKFDKKTYGPWRYDYSEDVSSSCELHWYVRTVTVTGRDIHHRVDGNSIHHFVQSFRYTYDMDWDWSPCDSGPLQLPD